MGVSTSVDNPPLPLLPTRDCLPELIIMLDRIEQYTYLLIHFGSLYFKQGMIPVITILFIAEKSINVSFTDI